MARVHSHVELILLLACASLLAPAQGTRDSDYAARTVDSNDTSFTVSKEVDEVSLVFSATDSKGHLVTDLSAGELSLLDNHQPPERILYFQKQSSLPLRLALLIDSSNSVAGRFDFEKDAASIFLKKIVRPGIDQAFVIAFNDQVHLLQDFTSDPLLLRHSLKRIKPAGNTALYDTLWYASRKLNSRNDAEITRNLIILISDGMDTRSRASLKEAQQAMLRANVIVYSLSTNNLHESPYPRGESVLQLLSGYTGGEILPAREPWQLKHALGKVEKDLRAQYVMGYTPADLTRNGNFHSITIGVKRGGLKIRCRRGYYAIR